MPLAIFQLRLPKKKNPPTLCCDTLSEVELKLILSKKKVRVAIAACVIIKLSHYLIFKSCKSRKSRLIL
jgi:hypothetical protein